MSSIAKSVPVAMSSGPLWKMVSAFIPCAAIAPAARAAATAQEVSGRIAEHASTHEQVTRPLTVQFAFIRFKEPERHGTHFLPDPIAGELLALTLLKFQLRPP